MQTERNGKEMVEGAKDEKVGWRIVEACAGFRLRVQFRRHRVLTVNSLIKLQVNRFSVNVAYCRPNFVIITSQCRIFCA